jgi:nucleotide-binding universal stress UspA family protein
MATVLARQGVKAVAEGLETNGLNTGGALLRLANDRDAELLVMGAYAHSRLRQYIFGGATQHVMEHARIPVLMSH